MGFLKGLFYLLGGETHIRYDKHKYETDSNYRKAVNKAANEMDFGDFVSGVLGENKKTIE